MAETSCDIAIIGGGAAGFFGALAAAEAARSMRIVILERSGSVLSKVRISGGGRCNVTTALTEPAEIVAHYPRGGRELRGPLSRFGPADVRAWFTDRGVKLKAEPDGRVFPVTDRSATIIDCLRSEADRLGVAVRTNSGVERIAPAGDGLEVRLASGGRLSAGRVLLAGGGSPQAMDLARGLGHAIIPPVPSLFTFNTKDRRLAGLAGLSVPDARVRIPSERLEQRGPVLITHTGLSGPAVLRLSAWGARALADAGHRFALEVNWLGDATVASVRGLLEGMRASAGRRAVASVNPVGLPRRLWAQLVAAGGVAESTRWAELSRASADRLAAELAAGVYAITGRSAFKEEFVAAGGVELREVDFRTMQSRVCPALHLAGEVLDIDGVTGGFNFQSAWTTGWLAGLGMADGLA